MGDLIVFLALVVLLAVGAGTGAWLVRRRGTSQHVGEHRTSSWHAAHHSAAGRTDVVVELRAGTSRVAQETRMVESVPDDDPDYDARLVSALMTARSRAGLLNSQDSLS